jgi:hypothetical protein
LDALQQSAIALGRNQAKMKRQVTLDTNCLLDLEGDSTRAAAVRDLVRRHEAGEVTLSIPAIMASERQRGGTYLSSFAEFTDRLERLGVEHLPLLNPMGYYGVSFWGHAIWAGDDMVRDEQTLHEILHPEIEFRYADYCARRGLDPMAMPPDRRWRNAKCDVQVLWSHMHYVGDLLVTSDENFLKGTKLPQLIALGANAIARPTEAANYLENAS